MRIPQRVTKLISVLREDARSGFSPRWAKTYAVARVGLNLYARDAPISSSRGVQFIECEARAVNARLVDSGRRDCANIGQRPKEIARRCVYICHWTTPATGVARQTFELRDVAAEGNRISGGQIQVNSKVCRATPVARSEEHTSEL